MLYYSEDDARELVVRAGLKLLKTGLVSRTWGNISARISKDEFVITPSGRAYETLKPEDLTKVRISDSSWEGNYKPSSEKGAHSVAYALRNEATFIIHTHQFYASCVSLSKKDTSLAAYCKYALPGTDKLCSSIMKAVSDNPRKNAFILERHGAFVLGENCRDAFKLSSDLEEECKTLFDQQVAEKDYFSLTEKRIRFLYAYLDDYAQLIGVKADLSMGEDHICSGVDAEAEKMILEKNCAAYLYAKAVGARPLSPADALLQRAVYLTKYSKLKQ